MSGGSHSPLILKRGRCHSPGISSKVSTSTATPGTRCLVFLRRCLAIQLQKVGSFPNNTSTTTSTTTSCTNGHFDGTVERDAPLYWMYDSGYLIFQGFLEANLKCFWNGALMEAMKVLEFQGYIAPGVLLVSGSPCALEVVRAAWARNVLKPPNNYVITVVGDVEDCLVEPINQGQFTPLPEALCWIILDMTASGQAAVMESICSTLEVAFPDIQKPSKQLIYDTLAKLMAEKKLYQTSNGYFVMTPDKLRLSGLTGNKKESCDTFSNSHQKQILLTPEEAVVLMHGEIETVRDGNITHQAIQTNLADVICGGNSNDKVLYPRVPARIRSGYSAERLERRHSLRFFGHGRRSHSLQRTGSVRHISDKNEKVYLPKDVPSDEASRKHTSLFSRLFRRSGRMRRDDSPSSSSRPTFSAQFPPIEWFNRGVTHLHSVGTQTTYLAPSTDTLPKRRFDYDSDDILLHDLQQHRKRISTLGTPRTVRRTAHSSATLPRRSLKKISPSATPYGTLSLSGDKDTTANTSLNSRISSQNSVASPTPSSSHNDVCPSSTPCSGGSHSSLGSSKTVISKDQLSSKRTSPTHKSMSSASSGYNSLPRSISSSARHSKNASKGHSPAASTATRSSKSSGGSKSKERCAENSITFHMSAKSSSTSTGCEVGSANSSANSSSTSTPYKSSGSSAATTKTERSATTMTINGGNKTKIFVQQQHHNAPTRSLITFENSVGEKADSDQAADIIIVNRPHGCGKNGACAEAKEKPIRPSSLYVQQNNLGRKSHHKSHKQTEPAARLLETHLKAKFPSSETIQLEEKLLETESHKPNNRKSNVNVLDDLRATKDATVKSANLLAFGSETELNNVKNYLLSQNSNVDKINNLRHKNVLTKNLKDDHDVVNSEPTSPVIEHHISKLNDSKISCKDFNVEKELENLSVDDTKLKQYAQFPSLSDLSLRFTSLAAQSILKGVSYNSVDTLVEVNMAAEKKRNCEMNINTDLGVV